MTDALIFIHPGAGGRESKETAKLIMTMYIRWAERKERDFTVLAAEEDGDGIVSAVLLIAGSYHNLKEETGVHRVVRVPGYDERGRRHTSHTSVAVAPVDAQPVEEWPQIRSYVFEPYQMAKNHHDARSTENVEDVMDGEIDALIAPA